MSLARRIIDSYLFRIAVSALFIYAGAEKIAWPQRFALDIESYRLVPTAATNLVALYLPCLEMLLGVALWIPRMAPGAMLAVCLLLSVFILALISAWARGLEIRCGCFGGNETPARDYLKWVGRDLLLLAACSWNWLNQSTRISPNGLS